MKEAFKKYWWVLLLLAVVCIWVGYWYAFPYLFSGSTNRGEFGDSFGALNALFAGLAFAAMFIAISLQRKDIKLQRAELTETRNVLEGQKAQFEEQSKIMRKQSFEDTFFKLLSLHHEIINAMTDSIPFPVPGNKGNQKTFTGTQYLQHLYLKMHEKITNETMPSRFYDKMKITEETIIAGVEFCEEHQFVLGHYFRNLYQIIKFINESDFNNEHSYSDLIRAQLSSAELDLLFYNCLSVKGSKFKYYVEEFALLKHIFINEKLKKSYKKSAFKDKDEVSSSSSPSYLHRPTVS